jgi:hypothetical protein
VERSGRKLGKIKGQAEYNKFKAGGKLTRRQAMLAHCFSCNGFEASNEDCQGKSCELYSFSPYKGKKKSKEAEDRELDVQTEIGA